MGAVRDIDPSGDPADTGFSASLQGASLADLVQMECLSGAECVARITSGDDVGYLYFRAGRVVHAMSASNVGEAAALEILSWTSGRFEPCNAGWPDTDSIQTTVQSLLLRVAQARDESGRRNLLQFRRSRPEPGARPKDDLRGSSERPRIDLPEPPPARPAPPSSAAQTRIQAAVRVDPGGALLSSRGAGAEELGSVTALGARLARLVGDAFGLDDLVAIEAAGENLRTLIVVEKNGNLVGLRTPSESDLATVRERYGI
jgi:hypothetical protein